jgi:hypothetical protein
MLLADTRAISRFFSTKIVPVPARDAINDIDDRSKVKEPPRTPRSATRRRAG